VTLAEIIDRTRTRYALTFREASALTEAVIVLVDDGPLADIAADDELARKLGEPTMHRVAHRILEERLEHATLCPSVRPPGPPTAPEETREPLPIRRRAPKRCSNCSVVGHTRTTCPEQRI
jgi:hypothetical protein